MQVWPPLSLGSQMSEQKSFAAVDLGASSGRVILGKISKEKIEYEEVHRFGNGPIARGDGLYWDIDSLRANVMEGLAKLAGSGVVSIGVDSWAVDYGLLDSQGNLIRDPHHYRDERNYRGVSTVASKISSTDLYKEVGLQFLPFNTLYQLAVDQSEQGPLISKSDKALLIPDLFNFWLCGARLTERTNASTTGLFDPKTKGWANQLIEDLGLQRTLFADIVSEGTYLGRISKEIQSQTGLDQMTQVVTVGSHDTASAFVAVPSTKPNSLFVSSGTWSLLGVELDEPILTEAARLANFTNEGGVDGRIRFLKNVTGLWLLQESSREWRQNGKTFQIEQLIEQATKLPKRSVIDVNDERFVPPGDMPARIQDVCKETNQWVPTSEAEIVRVIFDSLVAKYVEVISELEKLTQTKLERIHIVGGGSQNALLNQLISDATKLEVFAGPVEATAIGNLVIQARAANVLEGTLEDLRSLIAKNFKIKKYTPHSTGGN
jgi:rhamnulokinase